MELVLQIVAFHMKHNAESEAVDLLMEVEDLDLLLEYVDGRNYKRTCLYLTSAARCLPRPDDMLVLGIAYMIYPKFEEYPRALQIALFLDNMQYVKQVFTSCDDLLRMKQLCYILARHIFSKLAPIFGDAKAPLDVIAFTAISLGLVYVGSCNEEDAQAIIFALMDRSESELGEALTRLLPLGLGLLYLGKQESVEGTAEVSKTLNEKNQKIL